VTDGWTPERVEMLQELLPTGLSSAEIARKLGGGLSRNAVIGKRNRLGLSAPGRASAPKRAAATKVAKPARPRMSVAKPLRPEPPHGAGLATVMTLTLSMCRWPIGDPSSPSFTFCGQRAERGSYCAGHAARAFVAPTSKAKAAPRPIRRFA